MFIAPTLLVLATVSAAALVFPPSTTEPICPPLRPIAADLVRAGAPGALVVVRTKSGVCRAARGLARRRPRVPLAPTDRFRIASITKTFVATVVLQFVAEGKLELDDPVERWLPGLLPDGGAITIRELLNHSSGLFDYLDDPGLARAVVAAPRRRWSPRALVRIATRHHRSFAPGQGWAYSNTNYLVLGLVLEAAGGVSLEQQLARRIFEPLGLMQTSFRNTPGLAGRHADGYVGFATVPRFHTLVDTTPLVSPSILWAAAGISSTGDDVTSFFAALLGGRLLPAGLLAAMESPASGSNVGLGLAEFHTACGTAYGHGGDALGYRSFVLSSPDGSRVALAMINVDRTFVSETDVFQAAEEAFCG